MMNIVIHKIKVRSDFLSKIASIDPSLIDIPEINMGYLKKLYEYDLLETFLDNVYKQGRGRSLKTIPYTSFNDFIDKLLTWAETPQGNLFWSKVVGE